MRRLIYITIISFLLAFPALSITIHVPGDYPTIQTGIDASVDGDTILVADGTYTGGGNRDIDYGGRNIVVISENGPENCVIDCELAGSGFFFHCGEDESSVVEGFTIQNASATALSAGIICQSVCTTIKGCIIVSCVDYGIYTESSANIIENCTISGNSIAGIRAFHSNIELSNCIIEQNVTGITSSFGECRFTGCIIADNGPAYTGTDLESFVMENCTVACNGTGIIAAAITPSNTYYINNTIVYGNTGGAAIDMDFLYGMVKYSDIFNNTGALNCYLSTGVIYEDPMFVNPAQGNFHLQATSPCIDAGNPSSPLDPDNTRADIGAFYYDQSTSLPHVDGYCTLMGQTQYSGTHLEFIAENTLTITTDSTGYYCIILPPETYNVHITHEGYFDYDIENVVITGDTTFSDITMMPVGIQLEGQISGTLQDTTYYIAGNVEIPQGETLLIEPGATIFFDELSTLTANGCLFALGTETDTIAFLPYSPLIEWNGLIIHTPDSTGCVLEYCSFTGADQSAVYVEGSFASINHCWFYNNLHGSGYNNGGAIKSDYGNVTLSNCAFENNTAGSGGAVSLYSSTGTVTNCLFAGNEATSITGGAGGLNVGYSSTATVENCTFIDNWATGNGGGLHFGMYSTSTIVQCYIQNNEASGRGGGLFYEDATGIVRSCTIEENSSYSGGGVGMEHASPVFYNTTINHNSATFGGGIWGCWYDSTPYFEDCTIHENEASRGGGGYFEYAEPSMVRCTLIGNTALQDGGGLYYSCNGAISTPVICSGVLRNNHAEGNGSAICFDAWGSYILNNNIIEGNGGNGSVYAYQNATAIIKYNDFNNNENGNFTGNLDPQLGVLATINANGDSCDTYYNIFLDPAFVDTTWQDYRLQWGSPCIDAGDPDPQYNDPDSTIADMGAFYYDQSMPARIIMTPHVTPIEIPATGGSFDYDVLLTNIASYPLDIDIWTKVILPTGVEIDPLLGPATITLGSETSVSRLITQQVPPGAPAGPYQYKARAAAEADTSKDQFGFTKLGADGAGGLSGWEVGGDSFEEWLQEVQETVLPTTCVLHQNYPNPFNPNTVISYQLSVVSVVNLSVYDIQGRQVVTLVDGWRDAGVHEVTFDGSGLASGLYVYRLEAGDVTAQGKMVLLK